MLGQFNKKIWGLSRAVAVMLFMLSAGIAYAGQYAIGETVFVAFPQANIKDDAFIIGKVTKQLKSGDYQISVLDYVEGHDYGSSCVPISKTEDQGLGQGWEIWQDTTKLDTKQLEYVVPKKNIMKLDSGKLYFVERNNLYIVFGRWRSDAPMLTLERLNNAQREAKSAGLSDMIPAFELSKLHRQSFYGEYGRPLMAFETIAPLNKALNWILKQFNEDKTLEAMWRAKQRDWKKIEQSTRDYFLIEAIDKVINDAKDQLYEDGVEEADPKDLNSLKAKLDKLKRDE
ncbi:hypothetical protein QCB45_01475 [Thiomicrorhabdus sp. ZW0627]|uniref:hypothetical protein n=1 Tax=Thiomicrorhabdus sp. ZW0627 TaxID=3039774 RepID=UPI0024372DE3|nr:hypothetical protein [Thiomicrorhabdus sp. ZW0627]MDG6772985.1 hypothetical protein [Thiomicrorhabdus sp. ZW0627]